MLRWKFQFALWSCDNVLSRTLQEPDEQEAPDDQDSSPPEDTSLYPHSPGTTQFQQVASRGILLCLSKFSCSVYKEFSKEQDTGLVGCAQDVLLLVYEKQRKENNVCFRSANV